MPKKYNEVFVLHNGKWLWLSETPFKTVGDWRKSYDDFKGPNPLRPTDKMCFAIKKVK